MKPPLFTYEEIERILYVFENYAVGDAIEGSIITKCRTTVNADPKFREPHK